MAPIDVADGAASSTGVGGGSVMAVRTVVSVAMPGDATPVSLAGIVLPDAAGGPPLDLGAGPGRALLTVIRHRH